MPDCSAEVASLKARVKELERVVLAPPCRACMGGGVVLTTDKPPRKAFCSKCEGWGREIRPTGDKDTP